MNDNGRKTDSETIYADIINLPHHVSNKRAHMSLHDRAAQFAPFAALTGYDEMISEETRQTHKRIELDASTIEEINRRIVYLYNEISNGRHPKVSVTHFVEDGVKDGGAYLTNTSLVKRIDKTGKLLILKNEDSLSGDIYIDFEDVLEINGDCFIE